MDYTTNLTTKVQLHCIVQVSHWGFALQRLLFEVSVSYCRGIIHDCRWALQQSSL